MRVILQGGVTPEVESGPLAVAVIIAYFAVVVGIGLYYFKRSRQSTGDFWIAGGQIKTYTQVFAFYAVLASAGSFFGIGGFAYAFGASFGMLVAVAVAAGGLFTMIFLAGPIRRAGVYTVPAYLQMRYQSKRVRLVGALIFAIAAWAYMIPQLTAGGITMDFVLPQLGYGLGVIIAAIGFALYVSLGGMWAVTWTDFIQGIMMVILSVFPIPLILLEFGGVSGTLSAALAANSEFAGSNQPWITHLGIGLVWVLGVLSLPQFGQRILSSESDRAARRGFMWMVPLYIATFGLSAYIVAGAATAVEPNLANPDYFYYAILAEYFGPIVQGLGAAGLLAAIMSTTDALLVALSASISHDIPKTLEWDLSERQELIVGQVVIWGGALTTALVALDPPGLIATMTTLVTGGLASGLFPAVAIGTWWKRANEPGAIAAMITGFLVYGALLFGDVMGPLFAEALIAVPVGIVVFFVVSLATRQPTGQELVGFQTFHSDSIVPESGANAGVTVGTDDD
ncbi:cation/acetate symporter ActP [Halalkalicoccus paucihalophilus]|uniref:Cation/acetate symporter ActP n=1 Tax=Halalkalicoccus paucihalophilus TaxID=1008153 RepID=A0A151A9Y8_9EURY|nr:sodium:solute symporter family protein [Halalkalicoccus paucihalophilus]KYH24518.1 cation/acetate symporter ActP [Halalkalicoccus paucihalophilus]